MCSDKEIDIFLNAKLQGIQQIGGTIIRTLGMEHYPSSL
jgi:hypothetical protein